MSEVKRYEFTVYHARFYDSPEPPAGVDEHDEGQLVKYKDYARLEKQLEEIGGVIKLLKLIREPVIELMCPQLLEALKELEDD